MKLEQTLLLFLLGCIPVRLLVTFIAKIANLTVLRILGILFLIPATGITYYAISGTRNNVGAFGEKVWWNSMRPVHAILFFCFAYYAIIGNKCAYVYLLIDTIMSLFSFLYFHSMNGDFSKVFL